MTLIFVKVVKTNQGVKGNINQVLLRQIPQVTATWEMLHRMASLCGRRSNKHHLQDEKGVFNITGNIRHVGIQDRNGVDITDSLLGVDGRETRERISSSSTVIRKQRR